jgi:hypothetical protein
MGLMYSDVFCISSLGCFSEKYSFVFVSAHPGYQPKDLVTDFEL